MNRVLAGIIVLLLAACANAQSDTSLTATVVQSPSPLPATSTPAPPTATPTLQVLEPPVGPNDLLPGPRLSINPENIDQLEELAIIGEGVLLEMLVHPADPNKAILVYSTGLEVIDLVTAEVLAAFPLNLPSVETDYAHAFSPSADYFAYVGTTEVTILNLERGTELKLPVKSLSYSPVGLAFSPDSKYLVLAAPWQPTLLIELATGESRELGEFLSTVRFSKDSQHLAVASSWVLTIYSMPGFEQEGSITSGKSIREVEFLPDGNLLLITENSLRKYAFPGLALLDEVSDPSRFWRTFIVSADGQLLLAGSEINFQFRTWNLIDLTPLATVTEQYGVALAPDGSVFVSRGRQEVVLWDAKSGEELASSSGYADNFFFSADSAYVLAASRDYLRVINTRSHSTENLPNAVLVDAWDEAFAYLQNGQLVIRDFAGTQRRSSVSHANMGKALLSAGLVAVWGNRAEVNLHDIQTAELIASLPMRQTAAQAMQNLQAFPDWDLASDVKGEFGRLMDASFGGPVYSGDMTYRIDDNRVIFYQKLSGGQIDENAPLFELPIPGYIRDQVTGDIYVGMTAIDPVNNLFYLAAAGGARESLVRVYDLEKQTVVREYLYAAMKDTEDASYYCDYDFFALSYDYSRLALVDEDCNIQVVDTSTWRTLYAVDAGASSNERFLGFSEDGELLATAFGGDQVKIWDAETGELLKILYASGGYADTTPYVNFAFIEKTMAVYTNGQLVIWGVLEK